MKSTTLITNVTAVPVSDHQRMYSSVPLGKKMRTSAKKLGTKTHREIQNRSLSIFPILQFTRDAASGSIPTERVDPGIQQYGQRDRRQREEQDVAAKISRLHIA